MVSKGSTVPPTVGFQISRSNSGYEIDFQYLIQNSKSVNIFEHPKSAKFGENVGLLTIYQCLISQYQIFEKQVDLDFKSIKRVFENFTKS